MRSAGINATASFAVLIVDVRFLPVRATNQIAFLPCLDARIFRVFFRTCVDLVVSWNKRSHSFRRIRTYILYLNEIRRRRRNNHKRRRIYLQQYVEKRKESVINGNKSVIGVDCTMDLWEGKLIDAYSEYVKYLHKVFKRSTPL